MTILETKSKKVREKVEYDKITSIRESGQAYDISMTDNWDITLLLSKQDKTAIEDIKSLLESTPIGMIQKGNNLRFPDFSARYRFDLWCIFRNRDFIILASDNLIDNKYI